MNSRKTFNKSIFATLLLICFICAVFFIVSVNVDHMTTDACFDTLDDATVEAASNAYTANALKNLVAGDAIKVIAKVEGSLPSIATTVVAE